MTAFIRASLMVLIAGLLSTAAHAQFWGQNDRPAYPGSEVFARSEALRAGIATTGVLVSQRAVLVEGRTCNRPYDNRDPRATARHIVDTLFGSAASCGNAVQAWELIVKLPNGQLAVVVQADDSMPYIAGQPVYVVTSNQGNLRVVPMPVQAQAPAHMPPAPAPQSLPAYP